MTKQEEIIELRKHPKHYLWDIPRAQWTPEDLLNLKNPNAEQGVKTKRVYRKKGSESEDKDDVQIKVKRKKAPRKATKPYLSKVTFTKNGVSETYPSIAQAARETGESLSNIYAFANNHRKPLDGSTWKKVINEDLIK